MFIRDATEFETAEMKISTVTLARVSAVWFACDPIFMAAPTTIHFVCTGNVYRSRLAEAYCVSRSLPGIGVYSSGIAAGRDSNAPISPHAVVALTRHGLLSYAAAHWQRTTADLVRSSDVLVFMEAEHHRFCEEWIQPARQRIEVWGVKDIDGREPAEIPIEVERTFAIIRRRTDALIASLEPHGNS